MVRVNCCIEREILELSLGRVCSRTSENEIEQTHSV
jgi:hypothetical protein